MSHVRVIDPPHPRGRLLIIDDDPDFAQVIREMLAPHGYEVEIATDRSVGRRLASSGDHDLIIIDAILESSIEGIELAHEFRSMASLRHKPLLLISTMTASSQFPQQFAAMLDREWPFDGYLEKPVDQTRLLRFLDHLIPTDPKRAAQRAATRPLVLVVDDDPDQQTIARETLGPAGLEVACVFNSYEAREWLKTHHAQLILLDVMMSTPTE
nr:response regulator [Candidatus Ozemobacteraceae bacterium]